MISSLVFWQGVYSALFSQRYSFLILLLTQEKHQVIYSYTQIVGLFLSGKGRVEGVSCRIHMCFMKLVFISLWHDSRAWQPCGNHED